MAMNDDREEMDQATDRDQQFSIGELSRAAGVSVRTIRYYIGEGLLPPTDGGGRAVYTRAHLARLRLIGKLKNSFLPLKEIRRQLAQLDDDEIQRLADEPVVDAAEPTFPMAPMRPDPVRRTPQTIREEPSDAATYIAGVLGRSAIDHASRSRPHAPADIDHVSWKRIPLGNDAELLIESDAYEQRRDRIDWLVDWARKVLS